MYRSNARPSIFGGWAFRLGALPLRLHHPDGDEELADVALRVLSRMDEEPEHGRRKPGPPDGAGVRER